MKKSLLTLLFLGALCLLCTGCFYNVISNNGADPSVVRHTDGYYYATYTTGNNVTLWRSKTISGLYSGNVYNGDSKVVWTPPATGPYSRRIWAPELQYINGDWYIYFAASGDTPGSTHRMYALKNTNSDPFQGTWTFEGKIADSMDKNAIDGMVLQVGDDLYFIWSGWEGDVNGVQHLFIAPMSDPLTISGPRVKISTPTYPWETNTNPQINEGPQVLIRNNTINLIYSASGSWTDTYCLGLITADINSDLLDPDSWTKHPEPIFQSSGEVYGPGHPSFTKSPDGTEDWIIYHAAKYQGAGWSRNIRAQKFTWNDDDTPNLGKPVSRDKMIPLPSGDPPHKWYEAEDAAITDGTILERAGASGDKVVGNLTQPTSSVTFTVEVDTAGTYNIGVRHDNGSPNNALAKQYVSVNGGAPFEIWYENVGWGNWNINFIRAYLNAGSNTITFTYKENEAQLDGIDVFALE